MHAIRRASTQRLLFAHTRRGLSSVAETTTEASGVAPLPRKWARPIRQGVVPAYDNALAIIRRDSEAKLAELEKTRIALNSLDPSSEEHARLSSRVQKLEIESMVNVPEVRWNFKHGVNTDMSQPIYRHLAEKKWRDEGTLDLLMERIYQMHVVPDVISSIQATADISVYFDPITESPRQLKSPPVEPGVFLPTVETVSQPRLQATVFHPETRLYTLMMVDPDVPNTQTQSFATYLHWLQPNIPLSALTSLTDVTISKPLLPYVPPHPQNGTPYHRYVTLLLPQSHPTEPIVIANPPERSGFDPRAFIVKHGLGRQSKAGNQESDNRVAHVSGGIHMWRAKWDEGVSKIYQDVLGTPEPRFGPPPKIDRYGGRKVSKYFTATQ